jgi:predicted nucleic acid-binding protein
MSVRVFVDTNVLLYLLSKDEVKADRAEEILRLNCIISVQVLNELTNVARRKLSMSWSEIGDFIDLVLGLCVLQPLSLESHERGRVIAERYQLSVYDAMVVASALCAGCETLYSEDMHAGLRIDGHLTIANPFRR